MKVEEIIEKLYNHEISKKEAIEFIDSIIDSVRKRANIKFVVKESGDILLLHR